MVKAVIKHFKYPMPDYVREFLSEFLGTFMQVFLNLASLAMLHIVPNSAKREFDDPDIGISCSISNVTGCVRDFPLGKGKGDDTYEIKLYAIYIIVIGFARSAGQLGSLLVSLPVSGGFLNPGISVCLATMSRLQWEQILYFLPAQYLGAFFAALGVHGLYYEHMRGQTEMFMEKIMIPSPHPKVHLFAAAADSVVTSCLVSMFVIAILNHQHNPNQKFMQPVLMIFAIFGILVAFWANNGVVLNPARDLGTRVYGAIVIGFKPAFSELSYCHWWLSQQVALYVGYLLGGWTYLVLFGFKPQDLDEKSVISNAGIHRTEPIADIPAPIAGQQNSGNPNAGKSKEKIVITSLK